MWLFCACTLHCGAGSPTEQVENLVDIIHNWEKIQTHFAKKLFLNKDSMY